MSMFGASSDIQNALAALYPQETSPTQNLLGLSALSAYAQNSAAPSADSMYNTKLSPEDERKFQTWLSTLPARLRSSADYDLRGAWKANAKEAANGHLPDTFKKPNHITYSDESTYSKMPGAPKPGTWFQGPDGRWLFWASPTNIRNAGGVQQLQHYFNTVEPNSMLILPPLGNVPGMGR